MGNQLLVENLTEATKKEKPQPTIAEFKKWSRANKPLALTLCKAMAFATVERKRVNAYIRPIFDSYTFLDTLTGRAGRIIGTPIPDPEQLYLCLDKEQLAHYYNACDTAHREHGFTGPYGHCPALVAEHLVTQAEWALLDAGCALLGLSEHPHMHNRQKLIDLLLRACLQNSRNPHLEGERR